VNLLSGVKSLNTGESN